MLRMTMLATTDLNALALEVKNRQVASRHLMVSNNISLTCALLNVLNVKNLALRLR